MEYVGIDRGNPPLYVRANLVTGIGFSVQGLGFKVLPLNQVGTKSQGWVAPIDAHVFQTLGSCSRKVDIRLPVEGNSNSHGARPVY